MEELLRDRHQEPQESRKDYEVIRESGLDAQPQEIEKTENKRKGAAVLEMGGRKENHKDGSAGRTMQTKMVRQESSRLHGRWGGWTKDTVHAHGSQFLPVGSKRSCQSGRDLGSVRTCQVLIRPLNLSELKPCVIKKMYEMTPKVPYRTEAVRSLGLESPYLDRITALVSVRP